MKNLTTYVIEHGQPNPGTPVAVHGRHGDYSLGYEVERVSITGQVIIKRTADGFQRRFTNQGREIGQRLNTLEFDVALARAAQSRVMARHEAVAAVRRLRDAMPPSVSRYASKESLREMVAAVERSVAEARTAVDALPGDEE